MHELQILDWVIFIFFRAADWKLDQPDWTGRLRVVAKGRDLYIKLEDKNSGNPSELLSSIAHSFSL